MTAPPRALTTFPSWLLSQAAQHGHRLVGDALAREGLRKHHFTVLLTLQEQGPGSQAELGRRLWLDRSDLHAVLTDLERDGLVARVRDERDRRRNVVQLTPAGAATLKRLRTRVEAAQEALLVPLSAAERRTLRDLLTRVVEHHAA